MTSQREAALAEFDRVHGLDREVTLTGVRLSFRTILSLVFAVTIAQLIIGIPCLIVVLLVINS